MSPGSPSKGAKRRKPIGHPRHRTVSRGSTPSAQSFSTQASTPVPEAAEFYSTQWNAGVSGPPNVSLTSPENMMIQAASQLQAHEVSTNAMDSSAHMHPMMYQPGPGMLLDQSGFMNDTSFAEGDSQMLESSGSHHDGAPARATTTKGIRSKTGHGSETELRQLFEANKHRSLQDVAKDLQEGNDKGPESERSRQIFAMIWISHVCYLGTGQVTRGRVYGRYADRCGAERVSVLNPASFGKLVRVMFPGLPTRRLGVRGESKYHYVNFCIKDDPVESLGEPTTAGIAKAAVIQDRGQTADPVVSPTQNLGQRLGSAQSSIGRANEAKQAGWGQVVFHDPHDLRSDSSCTKYSLRQLAIYQESITARVSEPGIVILPDLRPYLPIGTDTDAANTLRSLYRAHCTSLVEAMRFAKGKSFFRLLKAFMGTLTMPVQKLFVDPSVAPWIEACDFVAYQAMMRVLCPLALEVMPESVMHTLRNVSDKLVPEIREAFQGQPQHVLQAREGPAALFAALLDRLLRVNLSAHAAANMLAQQENRDRMYVDWITKVRLRKAAETLPLPCVNDCMTLMFTQLRHLLDPQDVWEAEAGSPYSEMAIRQEFEPGAANIKAHSHIVRWVHLVQSLPSRFPHATAADIMLSVRLFGTAVMSDLTFESGDSFGAWWVVKSFVDEVTMFLAEHGGFLGQSSCQLRITKEEPRQQPSQEPQAQDQALVLSNGPENYNYSSFEPTQSQHGGPSTGVDKDDSGSMDAADDGANHDSGISITTPDPDTSAGNFSFETMASLAS